MNRLSFFYKEYTMAVFYKLIMMHGLSKYISDLYHNSNPLCVSMSYLPFYIKQSNYFNHLNILYIVYKWYFSKCQKNVSILQKNT